MDKLFVPLITCQQDKFHNANTLLATVKRGTIVLKMQANTEKKIVIRFRFQHESSN